ncbi:Terminal uridylyltransferase 7 [Dufourea novaeangliae]|uniref:Terminal uridylyltransferase 7 n=1 Tax=Dufourea novaeangliae TaxID=178035 RepID=A0A154P6D6_DUFNO|nr:Terminal uridylyltransferase 7 [Dufourea novaeangliae]
MTTNFVEKCLICFDISDIKLCSSLKNKICYQCSICRANLNTDHNLIEHCQGRMHRRIMKQLYPNQECDSNSNETMSVLDRFNELSIIDKKSKTSNTIDIDSVTLKAVHTEITKYIQLSPFLFNTTVMHRSNEKTLTQHLNKMYCKTYLELEEEMYTLTEKRVDSIRYSLKFLTPMKENFFYCLGCEKDVPKELHLLYEHVCSRPHRDHQIKKLSKEYVRVISKASVFCHPCKKLLQNDCQMIDNHIKKKTHKMNYKMSCTAMNDSFDSILKELNDLYYSIQRFSCILCQKNFKYKIQFIEHIIIKHSIKMEYYMFDFCIPCATLWLDNKDSYTSHCKDVIHKYLQKSKDFMIEALPECITKLLTQVDEVVNILFEQTQVLMNDNIQEEVRQSLENGIKVFFPNAKAFLFGSRTTGLGFANSDIDVYIDCGNSYYQSLNEKVGGNNLLRIESVLHTLKKEWEIKELLKDSRTPIIKLVYKRTGLDCDVSVTNGLSVENSKLIRSFNDAYLPCRKLILFVKKWFSLFNLPISHNLSNYAICWLIIFYLQTKSCLPSVAELIKEKNSSQLICGWETGFAQPKCKDICVQSVPVLLHGFFEFYAKFDYQHYIVCPLIGSLVAKKAFTELDELPKDMKPYLVHLVVSEKPEYFRIDSPLCVQDPLDLSHNLTKAVKSITVKYFKQYCQASASLLRPTLD